MSFVGPAFPSIAPTARSLNAGDFPGTTFTAQNGMESRVQYGSRRSNTELSLSFDNISDADAALIHDHYANCRGTLGLFGLGSTSKSGNPGFDAGITALSSTNRFSAAPFGLQYRYAEPPQFNSVKPGRMSVTIKLTGVLDA